MCLFRFARPGLLLGAITLLAGCDSTKDNSSQTGTVRIEGPVQLEGPVAMSGAVDVRNPVRVEGPLPVSGMLDGIKEAIRVEGPVETTGRIQGIDSPVTVQGTVGLSGPVEVRPGAEPLRMVTADTDASRLVSKQYDGGWGIRFRAIEKGPLVLTSVALSAYKSESSMLSGAARTRLFYVPGEPKNEDCTDTEVSTQVHVLYLQADLLPAVSGSRILIPAGNTLCISGAYAVSYSGFRPY